MSRKSAPKNAENADTAFILAGGKSSRMPFDKQTIKIDGKLIAVYIADKLKEIFSDVYIISQTESLYQSSTYTVIPDEVEDSGPLGGLYTALCHATCDYVYVTGCDMPFVNLKYIEYMKEQLSAASASVDGIFTTTHGLVEPLNAFYHKRLKDLIPPLIKKGKRRMAHLYEGKNMICVPESILKEFDPDYKMFFNLNTLEEYNWYISYKS